MLKFFFDRNSKFVLALELAGIVSFVAIAFIKSAGIIFWLYVLSYVLIRFCAFWDWYATEAGSRKHDAGIRLHFKKMVVLSAYTIFIANFFILFANAGFLEYFAFAFLAFTLHINAILLYFHFKDKDPTPPNFFSVPKMNLTT